MADAIRGSLEAIKAAQNRISMDKINLGAVCIALTFIQVVYGNYMTLFGSSSLLIIPHIILAILILITSLIMIPPAKGAEKRIAVGNTILIALEIGIGGYLYSVYNPALVLLHFIIGLGILSNFMVLYFSSRNGRAV